MGRPDALAAGIYATVERFGASLYFRGYTRQFVVLEPSMGIEPMASSLPRTCSTTELRRPDCRALLIGWGVCGAHQTIAEVDVLSGGPLIRLDLSDIKPSFIVADGDLRIGGIERAGDGIA